MSDKNLDFYTNMLHENTLINKSISIFAFRLLDICDINMSIDKKGRKPHT